MDNLNDLELPSAYLGLDDLIHFTVDCWCSRSWCAGAAQ